MSSGPAYDLRLVQALVREGSYLVTRGATVDARALGFSEEEVPACILSLAGRDFYKSMPALRRPGLKQDVYRPVVAGRSLYVKIQIRVIAAGRMAVVISFKAR